jgi:pyruvate dehydrogenase E2 component (dihydrolipoyllysine-residue acetyltransferase)
VPEFRMPALGADMESGVLVEWLVHPGQRVKRGEVVAVVETQKGAVEVEIWDEGVIDELKAAPGTKVPVGELLATLRPSGAQASTTPAQPATAGPKPVAIPVAEKPATRAVPPTAPTPSAAGRAKVSPAARRLAEQLGVNLSLVAASAEDGVVHEDDVKRAAQRQTAAKPQPAATAEQAREPASAAPPADKLAAMRQAIAAAMAKSKREIPHYYLGTPINVERALAGLAQQNAGRSVKERVLFAAVLLKAVASALQEVPELNGFWVDGGFKPSQAVHLGVGIALRGGGLIAPAIRDADRKSVPEMMAALGDLIQRVRSGSVRSSELADATVTVTNLGETGVETVYGVIYLPQVALIGFGKIVERPWADNGGLYVRRVLHATLSADHRASVGHRGAMFLAALDRLLQEPEKL